MPAHLRACQKHATAHRLPGSPPPPTGCSRGLPARFQSVRQTEFRTGSAEFISQARFLDGSISFPSLTNVVGDFFLILLKMQLNLSHGICSFKNPDSCLLMVALCSWFLRFFFLHLHSITLLRIKGRLTRWQMPGSLSTPISHSEDWSYQP